MLVSLGVPTAIIEAIGTKLASLRAQVMTEEAREAA
jgi:hypothetical protein